METAPIHGQTQAQIEQGADPYYVLLNLESLATTNEAAEQWRKGWRDRQRAEAGPAVGIPRGQASVSQPLMAMQHSLARMRAVILEQSKKAEQSLGPNVRFWFTIASMSFLIVLLGAYLLWSFLPGSQFASQSITAAVSGPPPILALQNSTTSSFTAGQELRIQGAYFNAHSTVNFLLGSTRLQDTAQSTAQGTFTTEIHLPATLLAGSYALQAQDHHTGQNAFLSLTILPRLDATINTTPLEFITPGGPISDGLPFAIARGNNTPSTRQITIINTSGAPLQWNATALADNNLSWLSIDNGKSSGTLPAQGTDTITISATATDLASSSTPYMGHLIFTVGKQQAVIPVSLRVPATGNEVIVSSIPMSAVIQPGGGCLPTALTFINLGNEKVEWQATVNPSDSMYIHLDKSISSHGTLQPSGQDGDTAATYLTCTGVHIGENLYHITVQYNGITQDVPVSVLS
ncbi:hypothetical protein EPA93_18520 [Ktedonosporobacter rubrisoli]|uniref:BACON domain-containing protein n=1 Tax=Ktedonosporobacter rubrisoli TaxID=2509675 RepID=A0A4P6JR16_KTERU|nr:hypothetical protein [Ktedonosporobacter rubrisoli]QBD77878.1 hypothetical protein EPA93_18520 [Ktedonosporobacter rubrisoli]